MAQIPPPPNKIFPQKLTRGGGGVEIFLERMAESQI